MVGDHKFNQISFQRLVWGDEMVDDEMVDGDEMNK